MWNLKKGNFREEPSIVLTLKQIIEKFDKFKGYVLSVTNLKINYNFYSCLI